MGQQVKFHLYSQPLSIARITDQAPHRVGSMGAVDSHRTANPIVKCACEGSRLRSPDNVLMPEDLRWNCGGDAIDYH